MMLVGAAGDAGENDDSPPLSDYEDAVAGDGA